MMQLPGSWFLAERGDEIGFRSTVSIATMRGEEEFGQAKTLLSLIQHQKERPTEAENVDDDHKTSSAHQPHSEFGTTDIEEHGGSD